MELEFSKVKVITVAKVASANFLHCTYKNTKNKTHHHDLRVLENTLKNESDCLIIVGVRNPVDRNLSYLFQSYKKNCLNDVRTKSNNYKGEYCYIPEIAEKDIAKIDPEEVIELYFKKEYHFTYNSWFNEFFSITGIDSKNFNKEKGIDFYTFPGNNTLMIYTVEKLNENLADISNRLGIRNFRNSNDSGYRKYTKLYREVRNKIQYKKEYLDTLLDTEIMHFFYSEEDIQKMYSKYKIKED